MTNETDSFVQEVDESLRQDQVVTLTKRYGPWALGLFVVILVAIGGWQIWQDQQMKAARANADQFAAAQELARGGNIDGAKTAFEHLTTTGPQSYRVLARMEHGAILQAQGDLEGALRDFDAAAATTNDPVMKQSAQLRAAYIVADTQDFAAVQRRLQPLIDAGGQVSYLAKELLGIEAWEAGQNDLARDTLETLRLAFDVPDSIRQRAQLALAVIGPAPPTATPATPAAPARAAPPAGSTPAQAPSEGETK